MLDLFLYLLTSQVHTGMATYYTYEDYGERPLYCSTPAIPLYYNEATAEKWRWVALDVEWYEQKKVECFKLVRVKFSDGTEREFYALDAGPFEGYYIEDHPDLPIVVDIPLWFWPDTAQGTMSDVVQVIE